MVIIKEEEERTVCVSKIVGMRAAWRNRLFMWMYTSFAIEIFLKAEGV